MQLADSIGIFGLLPRLVESITGPLIVVSLSPVLYSIDLKAVL